MVYRYYNSFAPLLELVDISDLGSEAAGRESSSLSGGTNSPVAELVDANKYSQKTALLTALGVGDMR